MNSKKLICSVAAVLSCVAFSTAAESASANPERCQQLREQMRELQREIAEIGRRHGNLERIDDQLDLLQRQLREARQLIASSLLPGGTRPTQLALTAAQQIVQGHPTRIAETTAAFQRAFAAAEPTMAAHGRLAIEYIHLGCGDPPDACSAASEPVSVPLADRDFDPDVNRLANRLLAGLLAPDPSGRTLPVFARVLRDGSVVDYVSGQPLVPPVPGAPRPLSVGFDEFSPFYADQAVWVSFYVSQVPGLNQVFASFQDSSGNTLVSSRPAPREVTEIPSVWEVFPNGLFAIELSPVGAGVRAAQTVARPAAEVIGRATGRAQQIFERLQQLLEGFRTVPSPISRRRRGRSNGCHAAFNVNGFTGVGTNCSGRYGEWTWRVTLSDSAGRGTSWKFTETLRRDGAWAAAKQTQVFYHPFTSGELSNLTPEASRLHSETAAGAIPQLKAEFNGWKARVIKTGRDAGRVQHQAPRTGSRAISSNFRTTPKPGCTAPAPQGYKETSQF